MASYKCLNDLCGRSFNFDRRRAPETCPACDGGLKQRRR